MFEKSNDSKCREDTPEDVWYLIPFFLCEALWRSSLFIGGPITLPIFLMLDEAIDPHDVWIFWLWYSGLGIGGTLIFQYVDARRPEPFQIGWMAVSVVMFLFFTFT